jgi:hypothetical protein
MCIRCRRIDAPEPLGLCALCVMHTRVEVMDGLKQISRYLAAYAAFDLWLRERGFA